MNNSPKLREREAAGTALPHEILAELHRIVGERHVLTGASTAGFAVDWTGGFLGHTPAVVRPSDAAEVAAVLMVCGAAGIPVVPQGGNTGLVGGGVPLSGEVVLSLRRLDTLGEVDLDSRQVDAGAGVTLAQVGQAHPALDLGILIASRDSATVGGAVATNAGGVRVPRYGPMRAQVRGIEAVLSDGSLISHMSGLRLDNTGYDYPSLLAGSEGTLAVITKVRLQLVPRASDPVVAIIGVADLPDLHQSAVRAISDIPGVLSVEFFTQTGLDVLAKHAELDGPMRDRCEAYLLIEASGADALDGIGEIAGDRPTVVGQSAGERAKLWSYRERHPEAAGYLGIPIKLDVSVPAAAWVRLATSVRGAVTDVDPEARVITFGHVGDGNVHVNIVPGAERDGRHQEAVFGLVASLGGSISAEHGIGALKAPWLSYARPETERRLFARVRKAFDAAGILNPNVFPR